MLRNKVACFARACSWLPSFLRRKACGDAAVNSVPDISSEYCAELLVSASFWLLGTAGDLPNVCTVTGVCSETNCPVCGPNSVKVARGAIRMM
jgi:hypothetical protein